MSRATAKYLVLLAVATALFYWKIVFTQQYTLIIGGEGLNQNYAWLHFFINSVRQGQLPMWDPYAFAGRPFSGEVLPSAFYPPHLLLALVPFRHDGLIFPGLYHAMMVLTNLLCAFFTFALLRELRLSRFAAFVGACCFSLSGLLSSMLWPPYVESCIWLPAIFLFLLRALRATTTRGALLQASLSGLCLGMSILTGGLMFAIMQGVFVVLAALYCAIHSALWRRTALILAVVVLVGAGAGAIQLLPAWEYARESLRFIDGGPFPASEKIPYGRMHQGMWPQALLAMLIPTAFAKIGMGESWAPYVGALPLLLAIAAIWRCWSNLWVRFLTVLGGLAFLYTLGQMSPLNGWLYSLVPYLWVVRAPGRFVYLVSFSLAMLAAFGTDILIARTVPEGSWHPALRVLKWVAIVCAAALFVPALFTQLDLSPWTCFSLLLVIAACGAFAYLTSHPAGAWTKVVVGAFILFDLTAFHWLPGEKAGPAKPTAQLEQVESMRAAVDFVKAQPGLKRVRVSVAPEPNIGDIYRVHSGWGGGATILKEYSHLVTHTNLLNERYFIKPASTPEPGEIYKDANWKVYENGAAYPRAWIVHHVRVEKSLDAVYARIDDPAVDLLKVGVLEERLPHGLGETGAQDTVQFQSYRADRILADAGTDGPGLVVFSEIFYPGWRATVNGEPAKIYRVDGGLRGVLVPAGSSRIVLEYVPLTIYAGAGLSLATFLGVISAFALSWRKQKTLRAVASGSHAGQAI